MSRSKRKDKKVLTAYIDLNKKKNSMAQALDDLNDNSASPIHDDEEDYKFKRKNLVINVTQPIMAYQSQTKTEKSNKDDYHNTYHNKIDTGQTIKQGHQVVHRTEQNTINRGDRRIRMSQDVNNTSTISQHISSHSKNNNELNDVSSFEPIEISNNTILKQKLPDSMRM